MNAPLIAVSDNFGRPGYHDLKTDYTAALAFCGAIPVIIPCTADTALLRATLARVDGLLLSGGGDLDSALFGEPRHPLAGDPNPERDAYDLLLYRTALQMRLPVLAICRGLQVVNVAHGGTLYQDLPSQLQPSMTRHSQTAPKWQGVHRITVTPGTHTARLLDNRLDLCVNSFHHQAVRTVGHGLTVTAVSDDGLVEGLELPDAPVVAVQYHPERMVRTDPAQRALFTNWLATLGK